MTTSALLHIVFYGSARLRIAPSPIHNASLSGCTYCDCLIVLDERRLLGLNALAMYIGWRQIRVSERSATLKAKTKSPAEFRA
jgi:hypothetical protein